MLDPAALRPSMRARRANRQHSSAQPQASNARCPARACFRSCARARVRQHARHDGTNVGHGAGSSTVAEVPDSGVASFPQPRFARKQTYGGRGPDAGDLAHIRARFGSNSFGPTTGDHPLGSDPGGVGFEELFTPATAGASRGIWPRLTRVQRPLRSGTPRIRSAASRYAGCTDSFRIRAGGGAFAPKKAIPSHGF